MKKKNQKNLLIASFLCLLVFLNFMPVSAKGQNLNTILSDSQSFLLITNMQEKKFESSSECGLSDTDFENVVGNISRFQSATLENLKNIESAIDSNTLTNEYFAEQIKEAESNHSLAKSTFDEANRMGANCDDWNEYVENGSYQTAEEHLEAYHQALLETIENLDNISDENKQKFEEDSTKYVTTYEPGISQGDLKGCGVLSASMVSIINDAVKLLQIGVPILLIVFGTMDFGKAIIMNDQDAIKKATSSFGKRCVAGIIIFFLPLLISVILNMEGVNKLPGVRDIVDPLCRQQGGK